MLFTEGNSVEKVWSKSDANIRFLNLVLTIECCTVSILYLFVLLFCLYDMISCSRQQCQVSVVCVLFLICFIVFYLFISSFSVSLSLWSEPIIAHAAPPVCSTTTCHQRDKKQLGAKCEVLCENTNITNSTMFYSKKTLSTPRLVSRKLWHDTEVFYLNSKINCIIYYC